MAQFENKTDVVYISGTGSGKTLTFWMPMLYETDSITILVTALNILGKQTAEVLDRAGIKAINVTHANAQDVTFKAMKQCMYRLLVVNPELLMQDRRFDDLWKDPKFTGCPMRLIFDEGHCVSQWGGTFRSEYANLARLRYLLPPWTQFYVASATLPKVVFTDVREKLRLNRIPLLSGVRMIAGIAG